MRAYLYQLEEFLFFPIFQLINLEVGNAGRILCQIRFFTNILHYSKYLIEFDNHTGRIDCLWTTSAVRLTETFARGKYKLPPTRQKHTDS